ncbi:hypothetical protein I5Q34_11920 [Streptomyces sp. AV19]|uniref:hypothetical protein n=1 Tax=Streptomyces sp. AV19 TaxID=2793068 RepID=UPI0018FEDBC2|nr:hypothetical protein [Streptomyces sp. AV19]MBH1934973.1 hypothetical protein [Streptomyces sp. AV19]MDG4534579.1 hypothetical protein [Streptomyces sp. AV19]
MTRISAKTRARNEQAIHAAMERLLSGDVPPDGSTDLKTLARMAEVPRTAFYPKKNRDGTLRPGPYQQLAEEFDRRLKTLHQAGTIPDPKTAQIERLKKVNAALKKRLNQHEAELAELKEFKQLALSRITAQHLEIERLREQATADAKVMTLPRRAVTSAIGSCS